MQEPLVNERLQSFVERIERLSEEKANLAEDIKEVFIEVSSAGFDVKIVRKVIAERKLDQADRAEQLELFDRYWEAAHKPKAVAA